MTGFDIFAIALVLLVIFTLFAGVKTVAQGYTGPSNASASTPERSRQG